MTNETVYLIKGPDGRLHETDTGHKGAVQYGRVDAIEAGLALLHQLKERGVITVHRRATETVNTASFGELIENAMRHRGLLPLHPLCPCCHVRFDRADYPTKDDYTHGPELETRYGAMVCRDCAENHHACLHCGKAILDGEGDVRQADYGPVCGEWFCCAGHEREASENDTPAGTHSVNDRGD